MTTSTTTTYAELLDRIISDGIAEVREAYTDPKDHHKRDGAIEGFEACRGRSPDQLVALWTEAERQSRQIVEQCRQGQRDGRDYWKQRYKTLQLEWACNVISVGLTGMGRPPLLAHLPTARAAMKYADIVGVAASGAQA